MKYWFIHDAYTQPLHGIIIQTPIRVFIINEAGIATSGRIYILILFNYGRN